MQKILRETDFGDCYSAQRLVEWLGVDRHWAIRMLRNLFLVAAREAPDGDVNDWGSSKVMEATGWKDGPPIEVQVALLHANVLYYDETDAKRLMDWEFLADMPPDAMFH